MTIATDLVPAAPGGLADNWKQFTLLVIVNGFVGMMIGAERSLLPLIAERDFAMHSATAMLTFLVAFGLTKAVANHLAGQLAHRGGRRRVLIAGWLFALPVPLIFWWAPSWPWIVFANVLLGMNQGLAWSAAVIMKIDLAGPRRRGLAMGLNEFAGYLAVAIAAAAGGYLAASLNARGAIVLISGVAACVGFALTILFVRDTTEHVVLEQRERLQRAMNLAATNNTRRSLLAANQAGFANNLNDGVAWGVFPLFLASGGLSLREVAIVGAVYPATWATAQIFAGALSDRIGRRGLVVYGMLVQAIAIAMFVLGKGLTVWTFSAALLGLGTAAVYPTLIALVSDSLPANERAKGVGAYRFWRDLGYVAGALTIGAITDLLGFHIAIGVVATLTAVSGVVAGALLPREGMKVMTE
jgi:MFS family permease